MAVAARYTDNKWYRGQIIGIREKKLDVLYVDYGNKESLQPARVRALASRFMQYAMQVSLERIVEFSHIKKRDPWLIWRGNISVCRLLRVH